MLSLVKIYHKSKQVLNENHNPSSKRIRELKSQNLLKKVVIKSMGCNGWDNDLFGRKFIIDISSE